ALGARADAHVPSQTECFSPRARVTDEEGAGDACKSEREGDRMIVSVKDEGDCAEHRSLADAIGGGVEECAERRCLPAGARKRTVQDVEDRPDDERQGAGPVEEPR